MGRTAGMVLLWLLLLPQAGAAAEPELSPSQKVENTLAEISRLRARVEQLGTQVPQDQGLMRRVAQRRIEHTWTELADMAGVLVRDVRALEEEGVDPGRYQSQIAGLLREIDAAIRRAVSRVGGELAGLSPEESELAAPALADLYHRRSQLFDRLIRLYEAHARATALMPEFGVAAAEVDAARQWLAEVSSDTAQTISLSLEIATDDARALTAQLRELPDNTEVVNRKGVVEGRIQSLAADLHLLIGVMENQDLEVSQYREQIVLATRDISGNLLDAQMLARLMASAAGFVQRWVVEVGPSLLVKSLVLALILTVTWFLARVVGRLVERAIGSERFKGPQLLRDLILRSTRRLVLVFGLLVALSQVGVSIGPLLAGVGVAGFVIGFAMQDSLSNFASGVLILLYQPFDVGDTVEAGDVFGVVSRMSLVNTTILTFDNQTLVVPNTRIWGGVIKNVTAQVNRRVDLVFGISYADDVDRAEQMLLDIASGHDKVLDYPPPVVKLHQLGDSSVNFVVRPWVRRDDYWDVYWDVTREVKVRFDEAGISIPFPQREVHLRGVEPAREPAESAPAELALNDGHGKAEA